jgi:predicted ATPase
MNPAQGAIRTPDHRLRVFVSSTLKELAAERRVARAAIERLHLAPVMFELGARPHPPRELYRAYLHQSDIFLGLYAERYGWVAPGETVSGLEDEYNLATELPKLIYIREAGAAPREPRLGDLLDRIQSDDRASFKRFTTASELKRLIEADLATMLAERFDQGRVPAEEPPAPHFAPREPSLIPTPLTPLIGRERERSAVEALLDRDSVRLVTLIGPGGIGKSRLAIDVADRRRAGGQEVAFIDLSPVTDATLVPNAMAETLGVLDTGDAPIEQKLTTALRQRTLTLVLDNFEQVLASAPALVTLLSAAPGVKLVVTSRSILRVTGEYAVEVGPLALPDPRGPLDPESAAATPAVALFVERARAVRPDFSVTPENVSAVSAICAALEGVPLALELAAARIRILSPAAMLARLDRRLALLSDGARDLPSRQRTLRRTIEWSTQLLGVEEQRLLARLGVFSGGFSLDALEHLSARMPDGGSDLLTALGTLVDSSLVREHDTAASPRYSMLATVREYAVEQLAASGELDAVREAYAHYFVQLAASLELDLEGARQREVVTLLNDERDNLRAVAHYLIDEGRHDAVAEFAWRLLIYWWVGGLLGEVREWMDAVLDSAELDDRTRAIALYFTRSITLWHDASDRVLPGLTESTELFRRVNDRSGEGLALIFLALAVLADSPPDTDRAGEALERSVKLLHEAHDGWREAMALVTLGRVALMHAATSEALDRFTQSLALARHRHDDLGTTIALQHLGWAQLVSHRPDDASSSFTESLVTAAQLGHTEGVAYALEGLTAISAEQHRVVRAGRLLRASEALRKQSGLLNATRFSFHEYYLAPLLAGEDAAELERVRTEGADFSISEAVEYALQRE